MQYIDMIMVAFATYVATPYVLGALVFFILVAERGINGRLWNDPVVIPTFLSVVLICILAYLSRDVIPPMFFVPGYFLVGCAWSIYRYGFMVDKVVELYENSDKSSRFNTYRSNLENMKPSQMYDRIAFWVIGWPLSVFNHVFGNMIDFISYLVKNLFGGVFVRIHDKAMSKIKQVETTNY